MTTVLTACRHILPVLRPGFRLNGLPVKLTNLNFNVVKKMLIIANRDKCGCIKSLDSCALYGGTKETMYLNDIHRRLLCLF